MNRRELGWALALVPGGWLGFALRVQAQATGPRQPRIGVLRWGAAGDDAQLGLIAALGGPYVSGTGLMNDGLRTAGLIPTTEPYTALGFTTVGYQSIRTIPQAVLNVSGNNAIVDWVWVELRNATTPTTVLAARPALIQRDGDVVELDGIKPVAMGIANGSYKVVLRHRNHMGVMTANAVALNGTSVTVNLKLLTTDQYSDIGCLLTSHSQLMHDLQVNVFRHALLPQHGTMEPRRLALQYLHLRSTDDLSVQVRQHPSVLRMLQHRVDAAHTPARGTGIGSSHQGLQKLSPVKRRDFTHGWCCLGVLHLAGGRQQMLTSRFFQPEFQCRFVGIQPHGRCSIRTSNALLAYLQPFFAVQLLGSNQAQSRFARLVILSSACMCLGQGMCHGALLKQPAPGPVPARAA